MKHTLDWRHNLRWLRIREEPKDGTHLALRHLGYSLILVRRLAGPEGKAI